MPRVLVLLLLVTGLAEAFNVPHYAAFGTRTMQRRGVISMSESWTPSSTQSSSSSLVPVNPDNIKYTVGVTGAATGFLIGGPTFAIVLAVAANYAASKEGDAAQVISSAGQTVLQIYNLALKANDELQITDKLADKIDDLVSKSKAGEKGETVEKIESALKTITSKASELNEEYGLVTAFQEVLVKAADLSVEAIDAGLRFADENNVGDKVKDALTEATDKVKAKSA